MDQQEHTNSNHLAARPNHLLNEVLVRIEEHGGYFGMFSFTLLLHGNDPMLLETAKADVFRALSKFEAEGSD
jgi:hypothetical protein